MKGDSVETSGAIEPGIRLVVSPAGFADWSGLLRFLHAAYAYMAPRIDPPSSLLRMDAASLEGKAREEALIVALLGERLAGCAFARERADGLYIGKVAVDAELRRRGVARSLFEAAEELARSRGLGFLELETRIELTENHETFVALGFRKTAESAHPGYARPTRLTFRRTVHRSERTAPLVAR